MSVMAEASDLVQDVCRYSRLCYDRGLVGAAGGNLSARIRGRGLFLVTASGVALRDVKPENLLAVDAGGRVVEGAAGLRASKETGMHLAVYRARLQTNAVIHVHPPYAILFSAVGRPIPQVTISARLKLRQGPLVGEADPGSVQLSDGVARSVAASAGDVSIILLRSHGLIGFAATLREAFDDSELASDTARVAWLLEERQRAQGSAGDAQRQGAIVDLTALLDESIQRYPDDPAYERTVFADHSAGGVYLSVIRTGLHAGTHVDVPLHFVRGGAEVSSMPLDLFFGPAVAIEAEKSPGHDIVPEDLQGADIRRGDIVLFRTGWESRSRSARFFEGEWPGFSPEAVQALLARGARAIGGDIASADSPTGIARGGVAHHAALEAGLPIFEGLVNMGRVVGRRFTFVGLPLKLSGAEASLVRAVAILDA